MEDAKEETEAQWRRRLGRLIVEFRMDRDLTQEDLAGYVSRSTAAISRWENGKATPSLWDARRIGEYLGVPADVLFRAPVVPKRVSAIAALLAEARQSGGEEGERRARQPRAVRGPARPAASPVRQLRGSGATRE